MRKLVQSYNQAGQQKDTRKISMNEEYKENKDTFRENDLEMKEIDDHDYILDAEPLGLELAEIYKKLDKELPKIPEELMV